MTASDQPATGAGAVAPAVWPALIVVYIAWGSTYVAIRYMDQTIAPMVGAAVRFLAAGAGMYLFLWVRRGAMPRVCARELGSLTLAAVLLLAGGNGLVCLAERHVPAGLSALVVASVPLWLLLFRILSRDRPGSVTLVGLAVGFLGVGLLVVRGGAQHGVSVPQLLIVVGAALSWALGSWISGRLPMPDDLMTGTAVEMLIGGLALALLGPLTGERWSSFTDGASATSLLAVAFLALVGSVLAFTAYVWLLQNAPIARVSTYAYVNPVVAVVLGALLLGERITLTTIAGGVTIVVAVALVIRGEPGARAPARAEDMPEGQAVGSATG